jgi:hypothetical protein
MCGRCHLSLYNTHGSSAIKALKRKKEIPIDGINYQGNLDADVITCVLN